MHRCEGANNLNGLFTAGPPPTVVTAEIMNALQEEIAYVIESTGASLLQASTDTKTQLKTAIDSIVSGFLGTVNRFLHMQYNGVTNSVIETDNDGSLIYMSNVYETGTTIKQRTTGTSLRMRFEGDTGIMHWEYYTGNADDLITSTDWISISEAGAGSPLVEPGKISGSLAFQTTATPPTVNAGVREFIKRHHQLTANTNLSLAGNGLSACSHTLSDYAYMWMRVVMDVNGAFYYVPSFDTASPVASDVAVTSVSIGGTTATVNTGDTTGLVAGMVGVLKGATVGGSPIILIGKIANVVLNTSFDIETTTAGPVVTDASTKYSAYYRITTLHGTGAATGKNVDADITVYSPSPLYCEALHGYYLDQYGIPTSTASEAVYRIIGVWYVGAAGVVETDVISYKSGFDKNDNEIVLIIDGTAVSYGTTTGTKIPRYTGILLARGNDLTYIDSVTDGMQIQANKSKILNSSLTWYNASSNENCAITKNDGFKTTNMSVTLAATNGWVDGTSDVLPRSISSAYIMGNTDILRVHTTAQAGNVTSIFRVTAI